ncbi:unnamed protein product [Soboliphyme baturini]|uniref:Ig-like domain-containing protein n=1 Tax=Soboliphyme baturini TaxID=241478 RepID=A0A183IKB2_9BILA|nr:unnamed protein product [Soboliphyme baturini]
MLLCVTRWSALFSAVAESTTDSMPVFVSKPGKVSVLEGAHAELPCDVENLGEYTVTWFKVNDKEKTLLFADKNRMVNDDRFEVLQDDWHLHIYQTEAYDSAMYRFPPAVYLVPDKTLYTVMPGGRVQLTCFATGNPPPKIKWTKKDGVLPDSTEHITDEVIAFSEVSEKETGVYRCTGENGVKGPAFADVTIVLQSTPSVTAPVRFIPVQEGQTVNITCTYNAVPEPEITWIFDGYPIDLQSEKIKNRMKVVAEETHSGEGHAVTLIIYDLLLEDFGNYTCRARNKLGHSEQTIEVTGKPGTPMNLKASVDESTPDEIKILWTISSFKPILTYKIAYKRMDEDVFNELDASPDKFESKDLAYSKCSDFVGTLYLRAGTDFNGSGSQNITLQSCVCNKFHYVIDVSTAL